MAPFSILWQTNKSASLSLPKPLTDKKRISAFSTPLPLSRSPSSSGSVSICAKPLESLKLRLLLVPAPQQQRSIRTSTLCASSSTHNPTPSNDSDQKPPSPWIRKLQLLLRDYYLRVPAWIRKRKEFFALLLFVVFLLAYRALSTSKKTSIKEVPYSELVSEVKLGNVASVEFEEASRWIYFHTITSHQEEVEGLTWNIKYKTRTVKKDKKFLLGLLHDKEVVYRSVRPSLCRFLFTSICTIALFWITIVPVIWFSEVWHNSLGNSTKKYRTGTRQKVTFDDVQGVNSAKAELIEVVNGLCGTLDYKKLGAKLPTGILLVGPPGTGKTLLARAVAGEAGVPFFSVSASEFVEVYVGRGASRVRELFKEARGEAPAVVFIDELDAVGTERNDYSGERNQTLNQLLTEMDGFDSDKQVIVLAATNQPTALDPALLRPGRFSRKVYVGEPNLEGRKKILAVHLRGVPLEEEMEVVCDLVASSTEGFVGADLANIANEASLLAVRRGGSLVTREDILEAIEREKFGIKEKQANAKEGKSLIKLFPWLPSLAQVPVKK
ncbi:ATP-dependent zinc metalloprotease FTSH-like protein [Rhynchospora pubera]|uniref:ATP-dependent zinc metalloprotease FTSH-like protein n=1 Tax=Rhynchospora pubera TaxID=906938 RepID=A0AAV8HMT4_9POAL|nr:ATP-dependent zinc metalloprotease FTSH-like protein [Rhynchospora pubera]